jgi:GNAT superfamily N-acetyltransferase
MEVVVQPLKEEHLAEADRIFRLAFGTFLGLPNPLAFMGDAVLVRPRWMADPAATLGAFVDGELVGSNFVANWGSVGFFGPLTVRPDLWDQGIARQLLDPTMALFERWGTTHAGLFTFPHSTKHIHLYQSYGFWPRYLTAVMSKPVGRGLDVGEWRSYALLSADAQTECLEACRELTDALYPGLDLAGEIQAVQAQGLGDTVLLSGDGRLTGFAICHLGPGSEAGSGGCYIKFGAVRPGETAPRDFDRLLQACERLAHDRGAERLAAGVSTARHDAYHAMRARGFRTDMLGVTMQRPNEPGYHRPDVFAVDDWR